MDLIKLVFFIGVMEVTCWLGIITLAFLAVYMGMLLYFSAAYMGKRIWVAVTKGIEHLRDKSNSLEPGGN